MADLEVFFVHPTTDARRRARVDDSMTAQEVVDDLIRGGFVQSSRSGYQLAIKGGDQLDAGSTLRSSGVRNGNTLRIVPITEAGQGDHLQGGE